MKPDLRKKTRHFSTPLADQRLAFVISHIAPGRLFVDVGCGEGCIIDSVKNSDDFEVCVGIDVEAYDTWRGFLFHPFPRKKNLSLRLFAQEMETPSESMVDADLLSCMEMIEHCDDVDSTIRALLEFYQPKKMLLSTPNVEFNPILGVEGFRHLDHRFEWTRKEFQDLCKPAAVRHGYSVSFDGVGGPDEKQPERGHATQIAIFVRERPFERVVPDKGFCENEIVSTVYLSDTEKREQEKRNAEKFMNTELPESDESDDDWEGWKDDGEEELTHAETEKKGGWASEEDAWKDPGRAERAWGSDEVEWGSEGNSF
uniref:Small RNA 2'-O-methyltransferase n=1 Tax=Chromera velia CCMP2878 TaxID=1169474 RepID=A0A0G4HJX6_9ALVE|eukprot:Cvel_28318.t1-p1 / transcript=Cvel_28318.t1 / gene=Cvel_28318 / organism=Chromera_velia_CCMP2878 / gene_product=Small RNA 2'-O-methyltransferase, putative / transcript_product=Small RNA 2'-O-methyltransferase, putative / location=Cvel_scaffold3679:10256-11194(+) / protein_length=313 / sequence_SO=supercontig / SO=protein_coding / is_pseudo=false